MNGEESCLTFMEATSADVDVVEMVEEGNPHCVIFVYAVDDKSSFGEAADV